MKRLVYLLLPCMALVASCGEGPLVANDPPGQPRATAPASVGGTVTFKDDFETGLDPAVWYREVLGQGQWIHATEGGNGYIYSPPQVVWDTNNRSVEILTERSDFTDFTMTWDMRFHTRSWHQDYRYMYFRCGNQPNPQGYVINVGVWVPTIPDNMLMIARLGPDGGKILHPAYVSYPWILDEWYSFKLVVSGSWFRLKVWSRTEPEPEDWIIEAYDEDAMFPAGRIGFGDYWNSITDVDNVQVTLPTVPVALDVKPGSCPNPLNAKERPDKGMDRKGAVVPAAILGTADLDVASIDVSSLKLQGVAPIRHAYEDVATPAGGDACACGTGTADGYTDLTLKFDRAALLEALGAVAGGQSIPVTITGQLLDGTAIAGIDCVLIVP